MGIDEPTSELLLTDPTVYPRVSLRSVETDVPIAATRDLALEGSGYPDEAAAEEAANHWLSGLIAALAVNTVGADFGGRAPGSWFNQDVLDSYIIPERPIVVADEHALMVFESEPKRTLLRYHAGDMRVGQPPDRIRDGVVRAVVDGLTLSDRHRLAFDIFSSSFGLPSPDVRFVTLVSAIEAMLEPKPRSEKVQALVAAMAGLVTSSGLPDSEIASIQGSFRWLNSQSIGQAARDLVAGLGDRRYLNERAAKFMTRCYALRSRLVHGSSRPPRDEVDGRAAELERLVGDLIGITLIDQFGNLERTLFKGFGAEVAPDGTITVTPLPYTPAPPALSVTPPRRETHA